jgi:hypothetical protein
MSIHFTTNGLENTKWYEYLLRFGCGGVITAATGLIAHHFGPLVGGLFLAFPSIMLATVTLLDRHEGRVEAIHGTGGAVSGSAGLAGFGGVVFLLAQRLPIAWVLAIASLAWLAISMMLWHLSTSPDHKRVSLLSR